MNKRECANGIRRSWDVVEMLKLAQSFAAPFPLGVSATFRNIALDSESSYVEVYLAGLEAKHYNFILSDFSFFQYSADDAGAVRYAYYPNPFDPSDQTSPEEMLELVSEGIISEEEYMEMLADRPISIGIPLIRYENSSDQYREIIHPCSHLHIGFHSENRWSLSRVLTPFAFTCLIMRNYYPDKWKEFDRDGLDFLNELTEILVAEKNQCRVLPDHFFSGRDKQLFYFN